MRLLSLIQQKYWISRRKIVDIIKKWWLLVNWEKVSEFWFILKKWDNIVFSFDKKKYNLTFDSFDISTKIVLFNKPVGYVVSKTDKFNKNIYLLLPEKFKNYYYIWRLDKNSCWLLLLTNNPKIVNEYEHPKFWIKKEYEVEIKQKFNELDKKNMIKWIYDENEFLKFFNIEFIEKKWRYFLNIVLNEWKKRHIRRVLKYFWYDIICLKRISEWQYKLWKLEEWKYIEVNI